MEIKRERALITRLIYFAPSVAGKCDNKRLRRLLNAAKLPVDVYQRQLLKSNRINHKPINLHARINEAKIVLLVVLKGACRYFYIYIHLITKFGKTS